MLLLTDKGYYDYDYAIPDKKWTAKRNAPRNDEELIQLLNHLGIKEAKPEKQLTAEELQAEVMREEEKKRATQ